MDRDAGDASPAGAHPMAIGPSSPSSDNPSMYPTMQAHAQILVATLQQLLPKQPSIATGKQPVRVKVIPTDTGRTSVVLVYDPDQGRVDLSKWLSDGHGCDDSAHGGSSSSRTTGHVLWLLSF